MFVTNMLIEQLEPEQSPRPIWRLVYQHPDGQQLAWVALQTRKLHLEWFERDWLIGQIETGCWQILAHDPFADRIWRDDDDLTNAEREARDHAYECLSPLLTARDGTAIYFKRWRSREMKSICTSTGIAHTTLHRYVINWLQRGQVKNALLPDFHKRGAKGQTRRANEAKRGRPRSVSKSGEADPQAGINITPAIKNKMLNGLKKYYIKEGNSFIAAYEKMLNDYFIAGYEEQEGVLVPVPLPADEQPTYDQAYYWYHKERDIEAEKRGRKGRRYPLEDRPLFNDRFSMVYAPGDQCQMDASTLDIYLVNPFNPTAIVGKPTCVLIVDTFSNYITGFAITHAHESWLTYTLAIENMVHDKVAFCAQYGITIMPEDWACHHLPKSFLTDRGPVTSYNADGLVLAYDSDIQHTAAYRPDLKGTVERQFKTFWDALVARHDVPGVPSDDYGAPNIPPESCLTLYELTQIMIRFILWYNNAARMTSYPLLPEQTADGVQPYPSEIWQWGTQNRGGSLRHADPVQVRYNLLPTDQATVTRMGIQFRGLFYRNAHIERQKWAVRDAGHQRRKLQVAYDPRLVDEIYLRLAGGQRIEICTLSNRQETARFAGCSWDDVTEYRRWQRDLERQRRTDDLGLVAARDAHVDDILQSARERAERVPEHPSPPRQTIRINRQSARRDEDRQRLAGQAVPAPTDTEQATTPTTESYDASAERIAKIKRIRDDIRQQQMGTPSQYDETIDD